MKPVSRSSSWTHDQEEALTMSDRIAVMSKGKILQIPRRVEIYEHPVDRFVADFIGGPISSKSR